MKRYIAFIITVLVLASQACLAFADNAISFNALDIYNTVAGEGYYDAAGYPFDSVNVRDQHLNSIIHHIGDYSTYDVSSLSGGTYQLKLTAACKAQVIYQVRLDGAVALSAAKINATGSDYSTFLTADGGSLYIPDGTQLLTLADMGGGSAYLQSFSLEKISNDDITRISSAQLTASDVLPGGEGVGYHDERASGGNSGFESSGTTVCLRNNEWVAYDVSRFRSGLYRVTLNLAAKGSPTYSAAVDDVTAVEGMSLAATGDYTVYDDRILGYVSFDGTQQVLKLMTAANASYLASITLERMNPISISGTKTLSNEHGVGFYDTSEKQVQEVESGGLVLRCDEWARYDISTLPHGRYTLYIEASSMNGGTFSVKADAQTIAEEVTVLTGAYNNFSTYYAAELDKTDETVLELFNTTATTTVVKTVLLCAAEFEETVCYAADAAGLVKATELSQAHYLTGTVTNYLASETAMLFSAFYRADGTLLSVERLPVSLTRGVAAQVALPLTIPQEAALAKAFLWSEGHGLKPLCELKAVGKGQHFYVSADGDDGAEGTREAPFKTIERAQQAVRAVNGDMTGNVYVHLSGTFYLDDTLLFTAADSGKNGYDVVWQGENATVHGGRQVSGWQAVEGTPLYAASVSMSDGFRQLYVNGNRAVRARSSWLYWPKAVYDADTEQDCFDGFILNGDDFSQPFSKPQEMEFVWMPSWKNIRMPVENLTYDEGGDPIVTFQQDVFYAMQQAGAPYPTVEIPYYIENAPEFLDEAGEWYYNKDSQTLFYYPREGEDMAAADCVIPQTEILLQIGGSETQKAEHIVFENINFCYGAWEDVTQSGFVTAQAEQRLVGNDGTDLQYQLIPAQVQIEQASHVVLRGNTFAHLGSVAVSVNNAASDCTIEGNLFDDVSATAVTMGDWKTNTYAPTETMCRGLYLTNNLMRRCGVEYMTPVVTGYYVADSHILHNDIQDAPYSGISLGWGWGRNVIGCRGNEIAYNKIVNVLYKLKDGGHVYTLGQMKNTSIHDNYFVKSGEWKGGIYLDNASAYISCYNNVFEDCTKWLKMTWTNLHDNTAQNNYAESSAVASTAEQYPELNNNIDEAIGKTDGEWPDEARQIMQSAGLTEAYQPLLIAYNSRTGLVNDTLPRQQYIAKSGIVTQAGDVMPGGEGEAYHDIVGNENGTIGIVDLYDGTGHQYLMNTRQGEWVKYEIEVPEEGDYHLILNLAATSEGRKANVYIDDVLTVNGYPLTNTGSYDLSAFVDEDMGVIRLTAGKHIFKVEHAVGNFALYSLRLEKEGSAPFERGDGFISAITEAVCRENN